MHRVMIREATADDASVIAGLHAGSWRDAYKGILPDAYLEGPVLEDRLTVWESRLGGRSSGRLLTLVATEQDVPVGFVCVLLDGESDRGPCLDNLHVLPEHQGRGIGRRLLERAVEWTRRREPGCRLHLWVFEENRRARRFYDLLEGSVVARESIEVGGIRVPSLCYSWTDLKALARRARTEPE